MDRSQKIVVALLIISVILSVVSVIINISVLKFGSDSSAYNNLEPKYTDSSAGKIEFFVESSSGGSNGG